jgi:hypothetical protein
MPRQAGRALFHISSNSPTQREKGNKDKVIQKKKKLTSPLLFFDANSPRKRNGKTRERATQRR